MKLSMQTSELIKYRNRIAAERIARAECLMR